MDFNKLIHFASKNSDVTQKAAPKLLTTKFTAPKKVSSEKPKGVLSANVKAFLEKKEMEEKQKESEERKKKLQLLELRKQANNTSKARAMASRTKDNMRVFQEETEEEPLEEKLVGLIQGKKYVSRGSEADRAAILRKLEETKARVANRIVTGKSAETIDLKAEEEEDRKEEEREKERERLRKEKKLLEPEPEVGSEDDRAKKHKHHKHKHKHKHKDDSSSDRTGKRKSNARDDEDSDDGYAALLEQKKKIDEEIAKRFGEVKSEVKKKPKPIKPKRQGPPPLSFDDLLKIANDKLSGQGNQVEKEPEQQPAAKKKKVPTATLR